MTIEYPLRNPEDAIYIINNEEMGITEKKKHLKILGLRMVEVRLKISVHIL